MHYDAKTYSLKKSCLMHIYFTYILFPETIIDEILLVSLFV